MRRAPAAVRVSPGSPTGVAYATEGWREGRTYRRREAASVRADRQAGRARLRASASQTTVCGRDRLRLGDPRATFAAVATSACADRTPPSTVPLLMLRLMAEAEARMRRRPDADPRSCGLAAVDSLAKTLTLSQVAEIVVDPVAENGSRQRQGTGLRNDPRHSPAARRGQRKNHSPLSHDSLVSRNYSCGKRGQAPRWY